MAAIIELYNKENIGELIWPESETGIFGKKYLLPLIKEGVKKYIDNIDIELQILEIDNEIIPITVGDGGWENSYVCSPFTHYVTYLLEELPKLENKLTEFSLSILIHGLGRLLKSAKANKLVLINNWLFSTNIYPSLPAHRLLEITSFLKDRFPHHAYAFKSVDDYRSKILLSTLKDNKGLAIASRKIYFWNPTAAEAQTVHARKYFRGDRSVQRLSGYRLKSVNSASTAPRVRELYKLLYLDKYSYQNPQYNEHFFRLAIQEEFLEIYSLEDTEIDGVIAFFTLNKVLVSPIVGYDTHLAKEFGLYRLLLLKATEKAKEGSLVFHASSGVGGFKKNRGCIGAIEYMVVFSDHLSTYRQLVWKLLRWLINGIGIPMLTKYEL